MLRILCLCVWGGREGGTGQRAGRPVSCIQVSILKLHGPSSALHLLYSTEVLGGVADGRSWVGVGSPVGVSAQEGGVANSCIQGLVGP